MKWVIKTGRFAVPVQEVAEIDSHYPWTFINLSANSNKKTHANHKKTKPTKQTPGKSGNRRDALQYSNI